MASNFLELSEVNAGFDGRPVLVGLSLIVAQGSAVAVIGPNGHGKTTLLRCISGLVALTSGEVRFGGSSLVGMSVEAIASHGLVHVVQGDNNFPEMTVHDNLVVSAHLRGSSDEINRCLEEVHALFPKLLERSKQIAGTLSGGENRMLSIGRGLMAGGRLLLLDEPSLGLAPVVIDHIYEVIAKLKAKGVTIVIVEENASKVVDLVDKIYLLDDGQFVWEGTPDQLEMQREVVETYLGG